MPSHRISLSEFLRYPRPSRTSLIVGVVVAVAVGLTAALCARSSFAAVTWRGDYETGDFSQWTFGVQTADPSRATVVTSVAGGAPRQGRYAARMEVDAGDNNVGGSGSGERTEALIPTALTGANEGTEQWWAWSTYFPSDFTTGDGRWNFFTQFHHTGERGQSNIEFTVADRTNLMLISNSGDAGQPTEHDYVLGPLQRGRWADSSSTSAGRRIRASASSRST